MKNIFQRLISNGRKILYILPLLILLPVGIYAFSDQAGKDAIASWMMQTPAKGLVSNGYDYYPRFLNEGDVIVYQKTFTDENGDYYTGAVIEVHKPIVFASPADTGSMEPLLGAGNLLIQEVVNNGTNLQVGDIVVYEYNKDLVIHQIVGENGNCYLTKGINNAAPDPLCITRNMIRYRLIFSIPTKEK